MVVFLKPDRVAIKDNEAVLIDYKTGGFSSAHIAQLEGYTNALEDMNFNVTKKNISLYK